MSGEVDGGMFKMLEGVELFLRNHTHMKMIPRQRMQECQHSKDVVNILKIDVVWVSKESQKKECSRRLRVWNCVKESYNYKNDS